MPPRALRRVEVDTVKTGRIVEVRESVGTVRAFESITVTAKVAGIIKEIRFEEGQNVKAGDVLVATRCRRAPRGNRAGHRRGEPRQRSASNEIAIKLDRAQALSRTGAGTGAQVDDLTAQVKSLDSSIASAQAQRKAAEARLEDLTIRAPFAGRVGTRSVSLGAYISPGTRITSLDDLPRSGWISPCPKTFSAASSPARPSMPRRLPIGAGSSRAWFRPSIPASIRPPARSA